MKYRLPRSFHYIYAVQLTAQAYRIYTIRTKLQIQSALLVTLFLSISWDFSIKENDNKYLMKEEINEKIQCNLGGFECEIDEVVAF